MATRLDFAPLFRSSIGFDRMLDALEAAASKAVDGNGKDAPRLAHQGAMASPLSRGAQGFLAALRKGRDKVVTVARAAHAAPRRGRAALARRRGRRDVPRVPRHRAAYVP